jgi:hypothetical protein
MRDQARPKDADELLDRLRRMFPAFDVSPPDEFEDALSLHRVMREFLGWFAADARSCEPAVLAQLGRFLDEMVAIDDALENAVVTCFLEHLRQVRVNRVLAPYLAQATKQKMRA